MANNIKIVRFYRAKNHPEMELFPTLKRSWQEPQTHFLFRIKELEDRAYNRRGFQLDETERAYPEETIGVPFDEWPDELQVIWNSYEKDLKQIDDEIDFCYKEIERLEKELYPGLDPLEFKALEIEAGFEIQCRNRIKDLPCWGLENLVTEEQRVLFIENSWIYHNNGGVSTKWYSLPGIPAELVDVRIVGDKMIREIVNKFADKGIVWIENQERMLMGLDLLPLY